VDFDKRGNWKPKALHNFCKKILDERYNKKDIGETLADIMIDYARHNTVTLNRDKKA